MKKSDLSSLHMLLNLTSYLACFVIPLFTGALALALFQYRVRFGLLSHWLIFSLIVVANFNQYGIFGVMGGYAGIGVGMFMIIPAPFINVWGSACLLASRDSYDLRFFAVFVTLFAMGYSSFMLGMCGALQFGLFPDEPGTNNWRFYVYACLLTVSPALVAILRRHFNKSRA